MVERFADSGHPTLTPHDHDGIVFPHVASGEEVEALRRRRCRNIAIRLAEHVLDREPRGRPDKHEHVVHLFRQRERYFLVIDHVVNFEQEPVMHRRVDYEARRVERISEHLEKG